jgi:hypothetical protein
MLSARILQAANSASYVSTGGMVPTIAEAVRNIGCSAVRDISASLGVFDAMPPCFPDGFNPTAAGSTRLPSPPCASAWPATPTVARPT